MLFRLLVGGLVAIGLWQIGQSIVSGPEIDTQELWSATFGVSLILIGILNFVFLYESHTTTPKYILLMTNACYIGFAIYLISISASQWEAIAAITLILICSILVLNRKV